MNTQDCRRPADTPDSASKHRLRLWLGLLKVTRSIEAEIRERLRIGHATTLPRFDVMAALERNRDGLRMSDLSGALKVSNGNVTGIIDRLVTEGHVVRTPVEGDRRAMLVSLTKSGRASFHEQAEQHETWICDLLRSIEPDEAEALATRLRDVATALEHKDRTQ